MVAETGGYRQSSRVGQLGSVNRSVGVYYGSTHTSYAAADGAGRTSGGSGAPVFGRIRITQSVEKESRNGESLGSSFYIGSRGFTPKTQTTVDPGRRYSLSTDRIWPKDRPLDHSVSGTRSSLQPSSFYGFRRGSLASTAPKYYAPPNPRHYVSEESGNYTSSTYMDGSDSSSFPSYRYGSTSNVSGISRRRSAARASSVSSYDDPTAARESSVSGYESVRGRSPSVGIYDSQNASSARASSVARYDSYSSLGRSPSVSRYENQTSSVRAPSVPRYEGQAYLARSPSVSRYESQTSSVRAPSVPRYEGQAYLARSPSVSRYEGQTSSYVRASSVSKVDAGQSSVGRPFRSASVSRYEASSSLGSGDVEYPRARSVARSEYHYESSVSTPIDSSAVDEDSAYALRRQLRALRNQQIRAGSVTSHEKHDYVPHQHQEHHSSHMFRPRSLSTSSSAHRRYKVVTLHTPIQVASPSNPPIITGYPEPTLYSAKVFRTLPGSQDDKSAAVAAADIAVSNTELGFIDNREDITSFVLKPGEKFLPTDVSVNLLPSGRKAVTYTQFSQKGHGDQQTANTEIERIIEKTKHLQDSMHTLEDFVKRNRSLFPEDIIIYQKIIFYLLSDAELIKMGEKPGAEVYGVKIRERLVAPIGTDVASILRRFYSRHKEVDVEYEHPEVIRQQLKRTETDGEIRIPNKGKPFDYDDLDLNRARNGPHEWLPTRRSRSTDYDSLYVDDDEGVGKRRRTPRSQRPSVPEFTHRLRRQRVAVGQSVRLSCSVSAFPEADVKWFREKQEITDNGRFTAKNVAGLCTLSISDVTPDDASLYTAKAINSEGETTTSALLEVYDWRANAADRQASRKQPSSEPTAAAVASGAVGRRPFFLLEARNLWTDVGERAVFEVQAAGKPLPSFTWIREEDQLSEDGHIQILSDGYGNCKLVIKEVRDSDFGTYRCLAQNEDGTVESIAALFCVGNESVRPGQSVRNELRSSAGQYKGRKPQFVHLPPSQIDVGEGEALTLQCVVDGDPKPLVTWYKGVRELTYTGHHRVLEERNNCYVMQVKSTLATDSGEYTVTAHNLCGLVEFVVCVNVLPGKPSTEDFDTNWKRPDLTPLEYELVTKTRQGKMPPIFVKKLPREKQMKVGESLKLDCFVEETKPREYLVDVDVVVKDSKKQEPFQKNADKIYDKTSGNLFSPRSSLLPYSEKEATPASPAVSTSKESEQESPGNAVESSLDKKKKTQETENDDRSLRSLDSSEDKTTISRDSASKAEEKKSEGSKDNAARPEDQASEETAAAAAAEVEQRQAETETETLLRSTDRQSEEFESSENSRISDSATPQSGSAATETTIESKPTKEAQDEKGEERDAVKGGGGDDDESSAESKLSSSESESEEP